MAFLQERYGGWAKVRLAQQQFEAHPQTQAIFWTDADSLFMNMDIPLSKFDQANFVCTGDKNGLNTGHFLLRNTPWSKKFLQDVWSIYPAPNDANYEQSSFIALLGGADPANQTTWQPAFFKMGLPLVTQADAEKFQEAMSSSMQAEVKIVDQKTMNSYPDSSAGPPEAKYVKGDFILHPAGQSNKTAIINSQAQVQTAESHSQFSELLKCISQGIILPADGPAVIATERACLEKRGMKLDQEPLSFQQAAIMRRSVQS